MDTICVPVKQTDTLVRQSGLGEGGHANSAAEGALAKSYYFQHRDWLVSLAAEARRLSKLGEGNIRYLAMWRDIGSQVIYLASVGSSLI